MGGIREEDCGDDSGGSSQTMQYWLWMTTGCEVRIRTLRRMKGKYLECVKI